MNCTEADGLLIMMATKGEKVTDEEIQALQRHLDHCERCMRETDKDEAQFSGLMKELFDPPPRKRN